MKSKVSLLKKIKIFRSFRKNILENSSELERLFNARIDNAYRIYSVINIPPEFIEEPYNIRRQDIDKIAETMIREYSANLSKFLDSIGLKETYRFYEVKRVERYSYLIVFGFSLFKSNKFYDRIRLRIIPIVLILAIILSLILFI